MIKVEMMQTDKGYSVAASGHADYAPKGQDIVCAAVSVLLQTLANKVEEAARQKQLESSCVQHGESFVVQAKPSGGMTGIMVAAWYDFVEEGLSELAGQYPDHVELYIYDDSDGCDAPEKALNLQKFAEGGDGGAGAAEGGAAEAEPPAVQAPALRPAERNSPSRLRAAAPSRRRPLAVRVTRRKRRSTRNLPRSPRPKRPRRSAGEPLARWCRANTATCSRR